MGLRPHQIKMLAASGQILPPSATNGAAIEASQEEGTLPTPIAAPIDQQGEAEETENESNISSLAEELKRTAELPRGSFRRRCGVCKCAYTEVHGFYHLMCPSCADFNWERRIRSADMSGMVAIVTGGRIRIGSRIVLKLLRAGAFVLTTTRFPADAIDRYSREEDFDDWKERLEVCGPLELSDIRTVEAFCAGLLRRFPRIHCLINNAAQTLTRPAGWYARMDALEAEDRSLELLRETCILRGLAPPLATASGMEVL